MLIKLEAATSKDAAAVAALRVAAAEKLTAQFGKGPWSGQSTEKGVLYDLRNCRVYVARKGTQLVASLCLTAKKPWAIDRQYFTDCARPLYLISMAVAPDLQRQGIGRQCLRDVKKIAREWPADAVRLDAYEAAAGAGPFYGKCGFIEMGRTTYRDCPLVYFEMLI